MKKLLVLRNESNLISETKLTKQKKELEGMGYNVIVMPENCWVEMVDDGGPVSFTTKENDEE